MRLIHYIDGDDAIIQETLRELGFPRLPVSGRVSLISDRLWQSIFLFWSGLLCKIAVRVGKRSLLDTFNMLPGGKGHSSL